MTPDTNDLPSDGETDCAEAVHVLYHFLDGELTDSIRVEIQTHLERCHHCLEAFEFEAELRAIIANRCRDTVPPEFRAKLEAVLLRELQ